MAESTKSSGGSSGKHGAGAGMTGTKESSTSGSGAKNLTPDEDDFDAAYDGPNSKDWRQAEEDLQADDDARRDRVRAEEREAREAADEHWRNIDREVKKPHDVLPEDKIRVADFETETEKREREEREKK